jgi:hypothetical protein
VKSIEDVASSVRGLPLLNSDKVWNRVSNVGLDELMQFDRSLVVEATALASGVRVAAALDQVDVGAQEARLATIREVMADRRRYCEIS